MSQPETPAGSSTASSGLTIWHPSPEHPDLLITAPQHAWLAIAAAVAGGHHPCLTGKPGTAKTLLAKALYHLLPAQPASAAHHAHRLAWRYGTASPVTAPPWLQPHHTCSVPSLTGTASRDGALGLAHQGVLFLDDAAEFSRQHLDAVAAAISGCEVVIAQGGGTRRMPACAQLVLASRPCPCPGHTPCSCSPASQRRYQRNTARLRHLAGADINLDQLAEGCADYGLRSGPLSAIQDLIAQARERRADRPLEHGMLVNSHASYISMLHAVWAIPQTSAARVRDLVERGQITVSRSTSVIQVAWTLADLAGRSTPSPSDVDTALALQRQHP